MAKEKNTVTAEATATAEPGEKLVKIKLFKDSYKYKDDVFVSVNNRTWLIQRGVEVEVPECVAEVLERSIEQDNATAELIRKETSAAKEAQAVIG